MNKSYYCYYCASNKIITILLYIAFTALGSCQFPKDPENSFINAQKDSLLVGVVENPPFIKKTGENLTGTEVELIEGFAAKQRLRVSYVEGSESELMKKLEKYELHLIIGGFEKKTIWKKKAGLSTLYNKKNVILVAKGENLLLKKLEDYIFTITKN